MPPIRLMAIFQDNLDKLVPAYLHFIGTKVVTLEL